VLSVDSARSGTVGDSEGKFELESSSQEVAVDKGVNPRDLVQDKGVLLHHIVVGVSVERHRVIVCSESSGREVEWQSDIQLREVLSAWASVGNSRVGSKSQLQVDGGTSNANRGSSNNGQQVIARSERASQQLRVVRVSSAGREASNLLANGKGDAVLGVSSHSDCGSLSDSEGNVSASQQEVLLDVSSATRSNVASNIQGTWEISSVAVKDVCLDLCIGNVHVEGKLRADGQCCKLGLRLIHPQSVTARSQFLVKSISVVRVETIGTVLHVTSVTSAVGSSSTTLNQEGDIARQESVSDFGMEDGNLASRWSHSEDE